MHGASVCIIHVAICTIMHVYSYGMPMHTRMHGRSHTRTGYPIRVWANIRIWGRTDACHISYPSL